MNEQMTCKQFESLLDAYLDSELDQETRASMIRHADECPACGEKLETMTRLLTMCAELDEGLTVPLDCQAAWRNAVREEAARRRAPRMGAWAKGLTAVAAALTVLVGSTFALRTMGPMAANPPATQLQQVNYQLPSNRKSDETAMLAASRDGGMAAKGGVTFDIDGETGAAAPSGASGGTGARETEAKIIRSATREIETDDFEADYQNVENLVGDYDGVLEGNNITGKPIEPGQQTGRVCAITARIPVDDLDAFLESLDALGTVTYQSEEAQDISSAYYDVDTRLTTYKAQRDRLNEMIADAQSVSDLIEIEDKLYQVQADIDSLEGRLRGWDGQVSKSQVNITLTEVAQRDVVQPISGDLGERAKVGFYDSINWLRGFLQDMAVLLATIAPQLIIAVPLIVLICVIVHVVRRRKRKK